MDELANSVLATLKKSSASAEAKVTAINSLKSTIKHQRIPENAQAITLECLRLAITSQASSSLVAAGLSSLGHLVKRLTLQDQTAALFSQRVNLLHILLERLGDQKETQRAATTQLFCDLWPVKPIEVEKVIREGAIEGSNVRAKIAGMQWVTKVGSTLGEFLVTSNPSGRCMRSRVYSSEVSFRQWSSVWRMRTVWFARAQSSTLSSSSGTVPYEIWSDTSLANVRAGVPGIAPKQI